MYATRVKDIEMSGIRRMFELAGSTAINLGLGEPDFQPPENVREALKKAIDNGHNKYASSHGLPKLRDIIAERLRVHREDIVKENILITASATEALMVTAQTFYDTGDEVLIPNPGFVLYAPHVRMYGANLSSIR